VTALSNEIGEDPVFLPLLQVFDLGGSQFCTPQAALTQDGNHCVISLAAK
jgi:hypothetical protein